MAFVAVGLRTGIRFGRICIGGVFKGFGVAQRISLPGADCAIE
jgi:hypothetical protein